jgi:formylglycine-generating enzyme required for sulfatase activity
MVRVPKGTLWLGSAPGSGSADQHPETKVELGALCVDAREVTVSEYAACEKNKACPPLPREVRLLSAVAAAEQEALSGMCSARLSDNADLPATCVSQRDAARYCAWKGERLPSESEWEWIATGGEDKLPWPWGTTLPSDANVCWQRQRGPCAVGSKPAGAFEVFDMAGNVAEWTATSYGPYGQPEKQAEKKVVRGGSWESTKEEELSPKRRAWREAEYQDVTIGFRCVLGR